MKRFSSLFLSLSLKYDDNHNKSDDSRFQFPSASSRLSLSLIEIQQLGGRTFTHLPARLPNGRVSADLPAINSANYSNGFLSIKFFSISRPSDGNSIKSHRGDF
jgi:hypothetical protein